MQQRKAVTILTIIMLVVLLAGALLYVAEFTDGFDRKFTRLYLSVGDAKFFEDTSVALGNTALKVHIAFRLNKNYTVKVVPAGDEFTYRVDDKFYSYLSEIDDLTKAFEIQRNGRSFTINAKQRSMSDVLRTLYPNQTVTVPAEVESGYHYRLIVSSDDGRYSIDLTFRCIFDVKDVEVDPPNLAI